MKMIKLTMIKSIHKKYDEIYFKEVYINPNYIIRVEEFSNNTSLITLSNDCAIEVSESVQSILSLMDIE